MERTPLCGAGSASHPVDTHSQTNTNCTPMSYCTHSTHSHPLAILNMKNALCHKYSPCTVCGQKEGTYRRTHTPTATITYTSSISGPEIPLCLMQSACYIMHGLSLSQHSFTPCQASPPTLTQLHSALDAHEESGRREKREEKKKKEQQRERERGGRENEKPRGRLRN